MPSLKEIKNRITSVQSTRKITSAMKMVASSKLHHAQTAIQNMLPYETLLEHILKSFLVSTQDAQVALSAPHKEIRRAALVVYSSNSSLCGGFNSNIIKAMQQRVEDYRKEGVTDVRIYAVGRKVAEKAGKLGLQLAEDLSSLEDKPNFQACAELADKLAADFLRDEVDQVDLIYHHFKSAGSQILTTKTLLPIDLSTEMIGAENDRDLSSNIITAKAQAYLKKKKQAAQSAASDAKPINDNFIVEPNYEVVLTALVPKLLHNMVFTALLDSQASEHAARMVAMQTATDNANELLRELNLQYNKSRQQAITNELLDIVGGSVNN